MSATKAACKQQVWRVMNLCKAVKDEEGQAQIAREVLGALLRHCQSDEHAEQVVTRFVEAQHYPGDVIADLVAIARETERPDQPPAGCDRCALMPDPATGAARWMAHVPVDRNGVSCAVRCDCSRGRWLDARDRERKEAPPPQPARKARHEHPADADVMRRAAGDVS